MRPDPTGKCVTGAWVLQKKNGTDTRTVVKMSKILPVRTFVFIREKNFHTNCIFSINTPSAL